MAKGKPVAFRFPDTLDMASVDEKADMFGMSRSAFVVNAIKLMMGLELDSYLRIRKYARDTGASVGVVMQDATIKVLTDEGYLKGYVKEG